MAHRFERVTDATIAQLSRDGYSVEDMELEWGPDYRGQYRWIHTSGEFQDWGTSDSAIAAWADALDNHKHTDEE